MFIHTETRARAHSVEKDTVEGEGGREGGGEREEEGEEGGGR